MYKILIVDDVTDNIKIAMNILREGNYNLSFALSGKEALEIVHTESFDLILLDIMMPEMDGYEVIKILKENPSTMNIPVIFLTAKADIEALTKGFKLGAADYITKPFQANELLLRVATQLKLYRAMQVLQNNNLSLNIEMEKKEERLVSELEASQQEMIYTLTELMESTSDETGKHIKRVAQISKLLATLHENMSSEDVHNVYMASPLHDIGKITIDQEILHKPSRLTEEEFEAMKKHASNAEKLLGQSKRELMLSAKIIAAQHHEKWNGKGYPKGLKGEEIHIYGRIVAIADVLDALTHKRIYKDSWSFEEASKYIIEHKGTQFDPYLIELFENNIDSFRKAVES